MFDFIHPLDSNSFLIVKYNAVTLCKTITNLLHFLQPPQYLLIYCTDSWDSCARNTS